MESSNAKKKKYSLVDKYDLGKRCYKFKLQYEEEAAALPKRWDGKRKDWTVKGGRAVREAFPSLARAANSSTDFQSAGGGRKQAVPEV